MADTEKSSLEKTTTNVSPSRVEAGTIAPVGADEALTFLQQRYGDDGAIGAVDEKKLVRKIDFMIVPLMWCCYFLQYLDKTLINYVSISFHLAIHSIFTLASMLIIPRQMLWDFNQTRIQQPPSSHTLHWSSMSVTSSASRYTPT